MEALVSRSHRVATVDVCELASEQNITTALQLYNFLFRALFDVFLLQLAPHVEANVGPVSVSVDASSWNLPHG